MRLEFNNHMVDLHKITEITKSKPKFKGVKAKPLWPFIPIINYCLPLLHMWMGLFNDVDKWFLNKVHELCPRTDEEREASSTIASLDSQYNEIREDLAEFDNLVQGKDRSNLLRRRNKDKLDLSNEEETRFLKLDGDRRRISCR